MKRTITILMAIVLSITLASAQGIGGKIFYDQLGTTYYASLYSSLPMGFRMTTQLSADDFTIPASGQALSGCILTYSTNYASSFSIKIYEDNAGWPGAEIESFEVSDYTSELTENNNYAITAMFPSEVILAEGKYWLSVAATDEVGSWYLNTDLEIAGETAKVMLLADFYGNPISNPIWKDDDYDGYRNLSFALLRNPDDHDLKLASINSPINGILTASETVSITIKNVGLQTQTTFDVMCQVTSTVDGNETTVAKFSETVSGISIEPGATYDYEFIKKVDLSIIGSVYSFSAKIDLAIDQDPTDNEIVTSVKNYGTLATMGLDKEITTCSAVFVDDGGVNNNYSEAICDTIIFYPETEGNRIALDFTFIDISEYEITTWTFYDGNSTDAPVIYQYDNTKGNLPTYVQARNAYGALTVVIAGDYFESKNAGWEANVSCVVPDNIDFTALNMVVGNPLGFNVIDEIVDITFEYTNSGADTTSRNVYLVVDNVLVDTLMTANLNPGALDTLHFAWIPKTFSDEVTVKVFIEKDGQETNQDNELSETVSVFASGILLESFEGGLNLPLGWVSKTGTSYIDDNSQTPFPTHGFNSLSIKGNDTVVMPRMQAGVIDVLRFDASIFQTGEDYGIQVLASKSLQGPWDLVGVAVCYDQEINYEIDLSNFANEAYYFAFTQLNAWGSAQTRIDYVRGAKLNKYDIDLAVLSFVCPNITKTESEASVKLGIANIGANDIMGADYILEIKTADSVYAEVKGIAISAGEQLEINAFVSFATVDTLELYFEIKVEGDAVGENNISSSKTIVVSDKYITSNEVIGSSGDIICGNYTSSLSEMIYYPSDVRAHGDLLGIEFAYEYKGGETFRMPLNVYIAEISDSLLVDEEGNGPAWIGLDSIEFVTVLNDSIDALPGKNTLYLPIENGFNYSGSGNIILLVHRDSSEWKSSMYIDEMKSEHKRFAYKRADNVRYDLANIEDGNISDSRMPNVTWHFGSEVTPEFISEPTTIAFEFDAYNYNIEVAYAEGPAAYTIEAVEKPEWLNFEIISGTTATLSATDIAEVGTFPVQLMVSDGIFAATQTFNVEVYAIPVFATEPLEVVETGLDYIYNIAVDYNGEGVIEFDGQVMPTWLNIVDNGDNTATLSGNTSEAGAYDVTIIANGKGASTTQTFVINVDEVPAFAQKDDVVIEEATDYSAEIEVNYSGANALTIVAGDNHNENIIITDNGDGTGLLTGTGIAVNNYQVHLVTSNGNFSSELSYVVTVGAVPVFTSVPVVDGSITTEYSYDATITYNGDDALKLSADVPEWMTFTNNNDGTASLTGTPSEDGVYSVSILAAGEYFYATQTYAIEVVTVGINESDASLFNVYPNPANNFVTVSGAENTIIEIRDITGKLMFTQEMVSTIEKINVSDFHNGIYVISMLNDKGTSSKRLVIN